VAGGAVSFGSGRIQTGDLGATLTQWIDGLPGEPNQMIVQCVNATTWVAVLTRDDPDNTVIIFAVSSTPEGAIGLLADALTLPVLPWGP
jgi:hypothetical protein